MPPLSETQHPVEGYTPVQRPTPPIGQAATGNLLPTQNTAMRCPVPQTTFSPDASTQFYRGNTVPQYRTFSPMPLTGTSGTGGGSSVTTNVTNSTTTTTTVTLKPLMTSLTTPVMNPGDSYTSVVPFSRMFSLIRVTSTSPVRARVYATVIAQTTDLSRSSAQAPSYGTTQGLIAGVSMDTAPFNWLFTPPATGANGDSPASPIAYVTINNIGNSSTAITVSFTYLPLES